MRRGNTAEVFDYDKNKVCILLGIWREWVMLKKK